MAMTDFVNLLKVFGKANPTDVEKKALLAEAALVTLARATSADTHIHPIEVEAVQKALKEITEGDFSSKTIRVAANSDLFDRAPLSKYLDRAAKVLDRDERISIVKALAKVIKSDVRVSSYEEDYFNMVCNALRLTPSQLVGLSD